MKYINPAHLRRPDWDDFVRRTVGKLVHCSCATTLYSQEQLRDHWQRGHFDVALPAYDYTAESRAEGA